MMNDEADSEPRAPERSTASASGLVDHFFRHQYGRLVARLCKKYGAQQVDAVEDAVQLALQRALWHWARRGIPERPEGWLARVAENALIDQLRGDRRFVGELAPEQPCPGTEAQEPQEPHFSAEVDDAELRMLFICCDETLSEQTRLVLCLKLLCGFSVGEIAKNLFLGEANVHKILQRGKERLKQRLNAAELDLSTDDLDLGARLASVQRAIYLQFTEGHSSHGTEQPIRHEVCLEALRLAQLLIVNEQFATQTSWALLALLHFQYARLPARTSETGDLVLLEDQDRSLWDREHIQAGFYALFRSGRGNEFSRYHGEAAILAEHCIAPSFEETRWGEIVELYEVLEKLSPSPLYLLNRAIALAQWKGPQPALELLEATEPPGWLAGYYLWDATRGELYRRAGDLDQARKYLERAIACAPNEAQRRLFRRRLAALGGAA